MKKRRQVGMFDDVRAVRLRRPAKIVVGNTYFLSGSHDVSGAYVKVLDKPTETNNLWWNSTVKVEMLVEVGDIPGPLYKTGKSPPSPPATSSKAGKTLL